MKILAFYLPQFHEIPENNEWWGKGFTEWVNVKKAKPLFKGHYQPKVPLNKNYYNLDDVNVMEWQSNLAQENHIDGFCFYHYWFNGKLLLNKPLDNYLNNRDIKSEYCFSWANEPWTRSWDGKTKSVLINQEYAGSADIDNHFEYMLPFFKDNRYIKIDNKPLFVIYRCNSISYLDEMIKRWNELAIINGFSGVYFVETLTGFQKEKYSMNSNAIVYMEPMYVIGKKSKFEKLLTTWKDFVHLNRRESYDSVWKRVLSLEKLGKDAWAGSFIDWDNSARKKTKNLVLTKSSPVKFKEYFSIQYKKALESKSDFIFINAWNEWAEGTYLEPDEKYKDSYLKVIKDVVENQK